MPRGPRRQDASTDRDGRSTERRIAVGEDIERDRRTQRRIERKVAKVEAQTHGGYAGPSIIEMLESHLEYACIRYLEVKDEHVGPCCEDAPKLIGIARGTVRGLAEAVSLMRNPYTIQSSDWMRESVKGVEKEFIRRAREFKKVWG